MKKIFLFILIIILFGLPSFVYRLEAAAEGTCFYQDENGEQYSKEGYTAEGCTGFINATNALGEEGPYFAGQPPWVAYSDTRPDPRKNCGAAQVWRNERCENVTPAQTTPVQGNTPQTPPPSTTNYVLISPLPCENNMPGCEGGVLTNFDPSKKGGEAGNDNTALGSYLNIMIRIFIGICAVLAVMMIIVGGLEYMTTELLSSKEQGRHRITGAIFGLFLALGSWVLLNQINPDLLKSDLSSLKGVEVVVKLEEQISTYTGQNPGICQPITDTSNPCNPENLTRAGLANGTQASSICNAESRGNATLASGVDKCSDRNSFSYGLFQVNILAHANEIPGGVCSNIFETRGGGTQGKCLNSKNGICLEYDCSVKNPTKLQSCVNYITNPTNNINYSVDLQRSRGWGQWGANASCKF